MRRVGEPELDSAVDRITAQALISAGLTSRDEAASLIDAVIDAARRWHRGELPLTDVRALFTPQERFLAARFVRPRPAALMALFDALVAEGEVAIDRHGTVHERAELAGIRHRIVHETGPHGEHVRGVRFEATAAEVARAKPGETRRPASTAARQAAFRTGLPAGDS